LALILASSSTIRRAMLDAAGVEYEAVRPQVDEDALKSRLNGAEAIASKLAEAKASVVGVDRQDDWAIGSDSVVSVGERRFDKPRSREEAVEHLRFFSGREMRLTSAVALARSGTIDWTHVDNAVLHVRPLSEAFIDSYLEAEWPEVGFCVGVFRMEGRGVQLFDRIDGNYFTILGMPLIPLLGAIRERGLLPA
jgi:septum formation protein